MNNWQQKLNLFYYNIFKFECVTQYWMAYPIYRVVEMVGLGRFMAKKSGKANWTEYLFGVLNDPKDGISLHIAGIQITAHLTVLLLTPWNIISGFLQLNIRTFWLYGSIVVVILAVVLSNYLAPSDTAKYLDGFKRFESMPKAWKSKSAVLTFLVVVGIWSAFLGSFVFYIRALLY